MGRSEADEASRGSAIRLAAEAGGRLLSVATTFLLAAALGVERFGTFAAVAGAAVIVAELADLGLNATTVPALVARRLRLGALLRAKLVLTAVLLGAVFALVLGGTLAPVGPAASEGWARVLAQRTLLPPLVLYFTLAGWSELLGVALRARGGRVREALTILCLRASTLTAVALALRADAGLVALAWAHAASVVPPIVLGAVLLLRQTAPTAAEGSSGVLDALRLAWPLAVNAGLALVSLRVELLVLFAVRGPHEAGLFAAALKVVESLIAVPSAITAGAMPGLAREAMSGTAAVRARTAITIALLAVPAAAGLVLVAPRLLGLLGAGYVAAGPVLRILAPCLVAVFMNVLLLHSLIAAGRSVRLPVLTAVRVTVSAALAVVLVPAFGARGAAAGFLAAEAVLLLLAARSCASISFPVPLARPLGLAAVAAAPMAAAVAFLHAGPVPSVAVGVAVYAATLAAAHRYAPGLLRSATVEGAVT